VWTIHKKAQNSIVVNCQHRLSGHDVAVTCVKYSKLEIFTGDITGRIFIWWMETVTIMRQIHAHQGPVKCMQFDAVHVVSGSTDQAVSIVDIATGEVVQSLRGHEGHILAVAFDSERIISAGGDNTLRFWKWGKKETLSNKMHVLNKGETLVTVSKLYGLSVAELMKWNGIIEARQCFDGMKLIVKKADPLEPTDAEKAALDRERRREQGMSLISKRFQAKSLFDGVRQKYDRVSKIAMDQDLHSMGNRMFKEDKKRDDIFPDKVDPNKDYQSLGTRLQRSKFQIEGKQPNRARYYISKANEEEWGEVSDQVALAMLSMFIEYDCYDIVKELKRLERDSRSVIGRINQYEKKSGVGGTYVYPQRFEKREKKFLMPEERKEKRRQEKLAKKLAKKMTAQSDAATSIATATMINEMLEETIPTINESQEEAVEEAVKEVETVIKLPPI
jgi:hypothetical protein